MSATEHVRLLVIGGGPAGFTAAMYAARGGLEPVCVEGYDSGGQISRSPRVENFPGQPGAIGGADLAALIREQAVQFGARTVFDNVAEVELTASPFRVRTSGQDFRTDAMIIATGSRPRRLGVPGEEEWDGRGVAYCAICDGPMFAGKRVTVIGGGDAAVEEVLSLRKIASAVTLVHRRTELRASKASQVALAQASEVQVLTPCIVEEILGEDELGVTGLKVRDLDAGTTSYVETDGVFVAVGQIPETAMFSKWLKTDDHGFLITQRGSTATNVAGVFAAGDVADPRYRQAVTAAGSGCAAAIDAERWLLGARSTAQIEMALSTS